MIIDPNLIVEDTESNYPQDLRNIVQGRCKKRLGKIAKLTNFGVNLVKLQPGAASSIRHWHLKQDEFIYVLAGEITLITNKGEQILTVGNCVGFPAGKADGHHLINKSDTIAQYLEIGDRTSGDVVTYPDVDLAAQNTNTGWVFTKKDGTPYESV